MMIDTDSGRAIADGVIIAAVVLVTAVMRVLVVLGDLLVLRAGEVGRTTLRYPDHGVGWYVAKKTQ